MRAEPLLYGKHTRLFVPNMLVSLVSLVSLVGKWQGQGQLGRGSDVSTQQITMIEIRNRGRSCQITKPSEAMALLCFA
ncbi:MAG: hypothetical protein ACRC53_01080 [Plesiomonas sp.]|uniref:hypothetical protein n=1 Tax=Plesiomonas sp. TaxID=2486279 RepID=UPI003F3620A6